MSKARNPFAIALMAALLITFAVAGTVLAVQIGNHDVSFVQTQSDYPGAGQSTWYYTVTNLDYGSGADISHLVFAACLQVATNPATGQLLAGTWDGSDPTSLNYGDGAPEWVSPDPTTGVTGIKFDQGFNTQGEVRHYFFVVPGNPSQAPMTVAIKAGQDVYTGEVTGPFCDPTAVSLTGLAAHSPASPFGLMSIPWLIAPVTAGALLAARQMRKRRAR